MKNKKKIGKGILSIILSLMVVVGMFSDIVPGMSIVVKADDTHTHDDITFIAWDSANSLPTSAGNYYLTTDVVISSTWIVPSGTINLCLNSHGIKVTGTPGSCPNAISINSGCTLNLYDCDTITEHRFSLNSETTHLNHSIVDNPVGAGLATVDDSLTENYRTFTGGYITGAKRRIYAGTNSGAVYVQGTFNMYGGTIIGNSACSGAGVFLENNNATFNMYKGNIIYNYSGYYGAGFDVNKGNANIYGGNIQYNYADLAGAIRFDTNANHLGIYSDANISYNYADSWGGNVGHACGGGVNVAGKKDLILSGSPQIYNNYYKKTSTEILPANISIFNNKKIVFGDSLNSSAKVGVRIGSGCNSLEGVFTSGLSGKGGIENFIPDDVNMRIRLNSSNEAELYKVVTVSYDVKGHGTAPANQVINVGEKATKPNDPTANGYTFDGWFKDESLTKEVDFSEALADNVTYYAKWTPIPATAPTISNVRSLTGDNALTYGYNDGSVSVTASAADGHTITGYQWYSNTTNSNTGGTIIDGATSSSYSIPVGKDAGKYYYYCIVTATRTDNNHTATAASDVATVIVNKADIAPTVNMGDYPYGGTICTPTTLGNTGNGMVTYYYNTINSNSGGTAWSSMMGSTYLNPGIYYMYATVGETTNYNGATTDAVPFTVSAGTLSGITVNNYTGYYDGQSHGVSVAAPDGATVTYGTSGADCTMESSPTYTSAGTYTVYYKVTKANYEDVIDTATVKINKRPVTVSGITADNKTYDANTQATLVTTNASFDGIINGDTLTVSATGTFSDSNVAVDTSGEAVAKTVNITDLTLGGEDVDNYILADTGNQSETTAIISKKAATITAKNQTVPLAGNITDSVMMADLSGALNGHELTAITLTPSSTENATTSGTITPSTAIIKNGSEDVTANYDITYINGVLTVEKAATDVTTPPSPKVDIVYNGELQALVTPGEGVTGGKIVYAVTLTDDEPDSSEYSEEIPKTDKTGTYYVWYKVIGDGDHNDSDVSHFTVVIDKKEITVSGITALDKTYDTTDEVTLNLDNVVFNGIAEGDKLTVTATGSFEDEKAGEDKNVDINVISLGGADADNYRLAQDGQQTNTTASIKKKAVTVTALDQMIVIDGSIDTSLEMAVLDDAIEGHELAEIILTSGSTASTTAEGVITPSEAKIVSGDTDVTDNYDITYVNGVMTVTKADSEVILDKTSVGEDTSVTTVESPNLQEFAEKVAEDGKLVKVELSVKPVTEAELEADTVSGIKEAADTVFANVNKTTLKLEYLEIDITKYVDGLKQGAISDTTTPIEIVVTYDTSKAGNPVIIRRHGGAVSVFTLLSAKTSGDYKDATYYIEDGKIYIYSQYFSDFAIVYSAEKTFNINLDNGMGGITRIIVSEGTKYTPPADFIRDGYDFGGWYKDETFTKKWNPDTDIVTADTKLFAQWIKKADTITPTDDTTSETKVDKPEDTDNKQTDAKKTIDTGDHSQVPIAFMLMLDSAMAMIYLTLRRKMIK